MDSWQEYPESPALPSLDSIEPLDENRLAARRQVNCPRLFDLSVNTIVVDNRPLRSAAKGIAPSRYGAVTFQSHLLPGAQRLAVKIRFQQLGPGRILENKPSLGRLCPPHISDQTKTARRIGLLKFKKPKLRDIRRECRGRNRCRYRRRIRSQEQTANGHSSAGPAPPRSAAEPFVLLFVLRSFVGNFVAHFVENLAEFDGLFSNINWVYKVPDEGTKG